ncbi:MAG: hypothetical protein WCD19_05865, partial [Nitrososphaeraceae archaeon]
NSPSLKISLILGTIIMVGTIVLFNNNSIYAKQAIWRDFDNMKDLVTAIRNGEKNDNNVNWEKFQDSDIYQNEDKDSKECLQLAHKIGNNLGDYEIVHCFRDENYFKNKYTEPETPEPQPETNASLNVPEVPETNTSLNVPEVPETNASLNVPEVPETNASEIVTPRSIDLNITVGKDPITRGENQMVTVVALDPTTGKVLDRVFIKLEIKDPVGILVKYYTGTEGNLTRTFKIGENATGTFIISATASQAGVQSTKSLTFQVQ